MQRAREEPAQPEPARQAGPPAPEGTQRGRAGPARVPGVREEVLREGGPHQAPRQTRQAGKHDANMRPDAHTE